MVVLIGLADTRLMLGSLANRAALERLPETKATHLITSSYQSGRLFIKSFLICQAFVGDFRPPLDIPNANLSKNQAVTEVAGSPHTCSKLIPVMPACLILCSNSVRAASLT